MFHDCFLAVTKRRLEEADAALREVPDADYPLAEYVTRSPAMKRFLRTARQAATSDSTLLLVGETGVGKGLLARSIHNDSPRLGPIVSVSCAALTPTLIESELFGHERGAFTGADRDRRGVFELAYRGTLFLDEIGELPIHLQAELLSVLEDREVQPLGSDAAVACLMAYPWPGNIRELANAIERAVIVGTEAQVQVEDLPAAVQGSTGNRHGPPAGASDWAEGPWRAVRQRVLEETERRYLVEVLRVVASASLRSEQAWRHARLRRR